MPQDADTGRIHLKSAQQRALAALTSDGSTELTRGQYQEIAGVSRSQAAYDLAELVEAGILQRLGGGRATRYRLVRKSRPAQRRWTSERIRAELTDFCAGRKEWPSASAFKAAGRADLYVAASRYGGIGFWAVELGFPRPGRAAASQVPDTPLARKFAWAGAGALAAALVVAAAAAVVVLNLPRESTQTVSPIRVSPPATTGGRATHQPSDALRKSRTPARTEKTAVRRKHPRTARRVQVHTAPAPPASSSSTASLIAVRTYSPPSSSTSSSSSSATPASHTSTPAPTASAGPSPLRAPLTASAPTPLKPPR